MRRSKAKDLDFLLLQLICLKEAFYFLFCFIYQNPHHYYEFSGELKSDSNIQNSDDTLEEGNQSSSIYYDIC